MLRNSNCSAIQYPAKASSARSVSPFCAGSATLLLLLLLLLSRWVDCLCNATPLVLQMQHPLLGSRTTRPAPPPTAPQTSPVLPLPSCRWAITDVAWQGPHPVPASCPVKRWTPTDGGSSPKSSSASHCAGKRDRADRLNCDFPPALCLPVRLLIGWEQPALMRLLAAQPLRRV